MFQNNKLYRCTDLNIKSSLRRYDIQLNDTQHNNKWKATLSIMALNVECCYAEGHLCSVSFMASVANKPIKLSVIMLSDIMLSVVAP